MNTVGLDNVKNMLIFNGGSVAALFFLSPPESCKECQLHILTLENVQLEKEIFSCAGYKGRGTINPESDFLNRFDDYSKNTAPNCPLKIVNLEAE
jgi:hypothetical protein